MEKNQIPRVLVCLEEAELKMSCENCYSCWASLCVHHTAGGVSHVEGGIFICCVQTLAGGLSHAGGWCHYVLFPTLSFGDVMKLSGFSYRVNVKEHTWVLFDSWEFGWHYASSDCGQMFLASVTEKRNDTPQAHSNEAFFIPTLLIPSSTDSWESPAVLL